MIRFTLGFVLGALVMAYVPRLIGAYRQARRDGFTRVESLEIAWRHRTS